MPPECTVWLIVLTFPHLLWDNVDITIRKRWSSQEVEHQNVHSVLKANEGIKIYYLQVSGGKNEGKIRGHFPLISVINLVGIYSQSPYTHFK